MWTPRVSAVRSCVDIRAETAKERCSACVVVVDFESIPIAPVLDFHSHSVYWLKADTHMDTASQKLREAYGSGSSDQLDWIVTSRPYKVYFNILRQAVIIARVGVAFEIGLSFLTLARSSGDVASFKSTRATYCLASYPTVARGRYVPSVGLSGIVVATSEMKIVRAQFFLLKDALVYWRNVCFAQYSDCVFACHIFDFFLWLKNGGFGKIMPIPVHGWMFGFLVSRSLFFFWGQTWFCLIYFTFFHSYTFS